MKLNHKICIAILVTVFSYSGCAESETNGNATGADSDASKTEDITATSDVNDAKTQALDTNAGSDAIETTDANNKTASEDTNTSADITIADSTAADDTSISTPETENRGGTDDASTLIDSTSNEDVEDWLQDATDEPDALSAKDTASVSDSTDDADAPTPDDGTPPVLDNCSANKIEFEQANPSKFEFYVLCVLKGQDAKVTAIDESLKCGNGGVFAKCKSQSTPCMGQLTFEQASKAITDSKWQQLCELSMLPEVSKLKGGYYL